jgi:NAD(P)-dependent dehydrogenase (short-subunit alcohol dehydrogenase family)
VCERLGAPLLLTRQGCRFRLIKVNSDFKNHIWSFRAGLLLNRTAWVYVLQDKSASSARSGGSGTVMRHVGLRAAIVLLASDTAAYITGANLPVDGGCLA